MKPAASLVQPGTVKLERLLPGPVERVWAYLTDSRKRALWFAGGELDLRVGGRVELVFNHDQLSHEKTPPEKKALSGARFEGTIKRLEPMRVLAYTWKWQDDEHLITFELSPRGKDVLLVITHSGLRDRALSASVAGGWDTHSGILADILNGAEPRPFWSTHAKLESEYAARL